MTDAFPGGEHPPQDLLAELAAGVLAPEQARQVEAHVMVCSYCEQFLADAERVRGLLNTHDPGPMPDDVWARIESGLQAGRSPSPQGAATPDWFGRPTTSPYDLPRPLPEPVPDVGPAPAPPPSMSFDEAPTAAWKAFLTEPAEPAEPDRAADSPVAVQQRVGRAVRSMRSRRDVRAEDRGEPAWWSRPGWLAGLAAAGLAVLGLGGWAAMSFTGNDGPALSAADNLPGTSTRSVVYASGADYTASTLANQATSLVENGTPTPPDTGTPPPPGAGTPTPPDTEAVTSPSDGPDVPAKPGTVADPAQLTACLQALGESDRTPLAVDLARYQGREAAVIVLPGQVSRYDVWVVARDCRPGAEGPLAFKSVAG